MLQSVQEKATRNLHLTWAKVIFVNPKKPPLKILSVLGITDVMQNSSWRRFHGDKGDLDELAGWSSRNRMNLYGIQCKAVPLWN